MHCCGMTVLQKDAPSPVRDRRRFARVRVRTSVTVILPDRTTAEHTAINVSAGGMLASPAIDVEEGSDCMVRVEGFETVLKARVISHRSSGTGLAFTDTVTGEALALWMVERAIRRD